MQSRDASGATGDRTAITRPVGPQGPRRRISTGASGDVELGHTVHIDVPAPFDVWTMERLAMAVGPASSAPELYSPSLMPGRASDSA
jgi:hypothetical protein